MRADACVGEGGGSSPCVHTAFKRLKSFKMFIDVRVKMVLQTHIHSFWTHYSEKEKQTGGPFKRYDWLSYGHCMNIIPVHKMGTFELKDFF